MLTLYIGNKNYSTWSLRSWLLLQQAGIPFTERKLRFDGFGPESQFKRDVLKVSPAGRVPVLVDEAFPIWDSLAIAEYVAEKFPGKNVWPHDVQARARARSVCAEMHSGFTALRSHCSMNIQAMLTQAGAEAGARALRDDPALRSDLQRIVAMWTELLDRSGGPMLFGEFSNADAYFAPVCMRIRQYALPVPAPVSDYIARVSSLPAMQAWIRDAQGEKDSA